MGSLLELQDNGSGSQTVEAYVANNSYVSREQVPLLHTFRTSHNPSQCMHNRKSLGECPSWNNESNVHYSLSNCRPGKWPPEVNQRSYSAEQISREASTGRCLAHPPQQAFLHNENDTLDRDSGFSTFPRSITLASVSNWSGDSPKFRRLPKGNLHLFNCKKIEKPCSDSTF